MKMALASLLLNRFYGPGLFPKSGSCVFLLGNVSLYIRAVAFFKGFNNRNVNYFMNHPLPKPSSHGFTRIELCVVILLGAFVLVLLSPNFSPDYRRRHIAQSVMCLNNLKQISWGFREFENNQTDLPTNTTPLAWLGQKIPVTNVFEFFQAMSNELVTPKFLVCPADDRQAATNFALNFGNTNISYFINLGSTESDPQMMVFGDDNLEINGVLVQAGQLSIPPHASVAWSAARHNRSGNVVVADGSVQMLPSSESQTLTNLDSPTDQIVIP